jgi:hypothetical protein
MPEVNMPMADWETVVMVLEMAQRAGLVAYVGPIIAEINAQLAEQET